MILIIKKIGYCSNFIDSNNVILFKLKKVISAQILNLAGIILFLFAFETSCIAEPGKSTASFLENKGQWPDDILFRGSSNTTNIYLLKDGISFAQKAKEEEENEEENNPVIVWNMKLKNTSPGCIVEGVEGQKTVYSFIFGNNPEKWVIHPQEYRRIDYRNIFKNIDLQFYNVGNELKYDYIIHPGGNVSSINAFYEGVQKLSLSEDGNLEVITAWNKQIQKAPVSWQIINGVKKMVNVNYVLINDTTFGFKVNGTYNKNYELIIDPLFQMVWSSYTRAIGVGNNINYCFSNAMDNDGNVYLTGMVDGTFPTTPGAYSGPGSVFPDIFVAKFSSDGTTMLYGTYLPANSSEHGIAIEADDLGQAYVTGVIDLNITGITNYPSTANAYQPVHDTGSDAFLTVLNTTGTGLVYSSFLGGTGSETGYAIALGAPGTAYITGSTSIGNFPIKSGPLLSSGDKDVFVAKFDINQTGNNSLVYSARFGAGSFSYCNGRGIAVNSSGEAFVTGSIGSSFGTPTFPITPGAYNNVFNTGQDGYMLFVTKLSSTIPATLSYSTFIAPGIGNAIAVDNPTGDAVITGETRTFTFPTTTGVLQPVHGQDALGNPNSDAFVTRLNSTGTGLVYSTFVGGEREDGGTGIAINSIGEVYISGITSANFPTSPNSFQPTSTGREDFFAVNLNVNGSNYGCGGSTLIGGSDEDYSGSFYDYPSPHLSLRDHGGMNDTILISSTTHSQDFPTTPGVYEPTKVNGIADQPVFFKLTCIQSLPPVTYFNDSISTTCAGATVDFTDSTLNNPISWQWSFPGASPSTSSLQHPQNIQYLTSGTYYIELISCNSFACDTASDSISVTIPTSQQFNIGNDTIICPGNSVSINAPAGFTNYSWFLDGNPFAGNQSAVTANQSGAYSVIISDSSGCAGADTLVVDISNPVVSLGTDIIICNNDSFAVTATPGYSLYNWTVNGNSFSTTSNSFNAIQPGTYIVSVTDSVGCNAVDTAATLESNVSVSLMNDTAFCAGNSVTIDAGSGFTSYEWELNGNVYSASNLISVSQSGNYILTVTNVDNCEAKDSISVSLNPLPNISITGSTEICRGDTIQLEATGASSYEWYPSTGISSVNIPDPFVYPLVNSAYLVTGTDANGCTNTGNIDIQVFENPEAQFDFAVQADCEGILLTTINQSQNATQYMWLFGDGSTSDETAPVHIYTELNQQPLQLIAYNGSCTDTFLIDSTFTETTIDGYFYIPNSFTPNADDLNNEFVITSLNDCEYFYLEIYNRWGELIHSAEGHEVRWDGTYNSVEAPEGVYVYRLKTSMEERVGRVTLVR